MSDSRKTFSVLVFSSGATAPQREWTGFLDRAEAENFAARQLETAKRSGWGSIRFEVREVQKGGAR